MLGAGLLSPKSAHAVDGAFPVILVGALPNPIAGGVAPFAPFGIFIHHNPLNRKVALADINDRRARTSSRLKTVGSLRRTLKNFSLKTSTARQHRKEPPHVRRLASTV